MLIYWWRNPPVVTILRGKITRVDPTVHPQDTPALFPQTCLRQKTLCSGRMVVLTLSVIWIYEACRMPPVICSSFWNEDEKEKEKFYLRSTLKQWKLSQRIIYRLYTDFEYKGRELLKGFLGVCPSMYEK